MSRRKLKDADPTGALEERRLSDGRRKITLRNAEREALVRRQRAEAAAALFLDLNEHKTWAEIAQELGLSAAQLRDLTKTPEFDEAYNALFAELGHDPRYRAAQAAIADMLPLAVQQLKNLLISDRTPANTRLRAIERVIALNGITEQAPQHSDREEMVRFLVDHRIHLPDVHITLPEEYEEALKALDDGNTIDGEIREVSPG